MVCQQRFLLSALLLGLSRAVTWCMTKAGKWQQCKSWPWAMWQCMNDTASVLHQVKLVALYRLWMWSKCCMYPSLLIGSIKHCSYFTQFCTWCKVNRKSDLIHLLKSEKYELTTWLIQGIYIIFTKLYQHYLHFCHYRY